MIPTRRKTLRFLGALLVLALLLAAYLSDTGRPHRPAIRATENSDYHGPAESQVSLPGSARKQSLSNLLRHRSPCPQSTGAFVLGEQVRAPDGPVIEILRQFTPQALSGDADAALKLYMKLSLCEQALYHPSDPEHLSSLMTPEDLAALKAKRKAEQSDCATAVAHLRSRGKWLELAAEGGDLQAQLLYSTDAEAVLGNRSDILKDPDSVRRYRDKATGYLKSLAARGSLDAMLHLSATYESGVLLERSDVLALAYLQAASLSDPDPAYLELSAPIKGRLTHSEQVEAMRFARKLHGSCCDRKSRGAVQ